MMQVAEAVHYFGKAGRTNHGVRLAKQHGMDSELLDLALKACPPTPPKVSYHCCLSGCPHQKGNFIMLMPKLAADEHSTSCCVCM